MKLQILVVPFWLTQALSAAGSNMNVLTNIPKLNDILSIDDVSFYLALNVGLKHHVPKEFMDTFSSPIDLGDDEELQKSIKDELIRHKDFKNIKDFINAQYDDGATVEMDKEILLGFDVIKIIEDTVLLRFVARDKHEALVDDYGKLLGELSKLYPTYEVAKLPIFNAYEVLLNKLAFTQLVSS